jgi:hypothetical protein
MTNLMTIVSYQPQLPPPLDESGQITMTIVSFGSNLRPHKMNLTMVVISWVFLAVSSCHPCGRHASEPDCAIRIVHGAKTGVV